MSANSKVLLVGLSGSGKTTYLAALWHLLEAGECSASFRIGTLQPDRTYLNRIRDDWLSLKEIERTSLRVSETASLSLTDANDGRSIQVTVPDLSGESFRLQWAQRKAKRDYVDYVRECTGVLLFVHPSSMTKTRRLDPADVRKPKSGELSKPWDPSDTSTQVELVELLQFVLLLRDSIGRLPVAGIISAWDLIRGAVPPAEWFADRLPLLSQFLQANSEDVPFQVYGISAQGGDLEKDRAKLRAEVHPTNRVRVFDDSRGPYNDLSMPLRFVLSSERGIETSLTADG